jgi:hypothetical protein
MGLISEEQSAGLLSNRSEGQNHNHSVMIIPTSHSDNEPSCLHNKNEDDMNNSCAQPV